MHNKVNSKNPYIGFFTHAPTSQSSLTQSTNKHAIDQKGRSFTAESVGIVDWATSFNLSPHGDVLVGNNHFNSFNSGRRDRAQTHAITRTDSTSPICPTPPSPVMTGVIQPLSLLSSTPSSGISSLNNQQISPLPVSPSISPELPDSSQSAVNSSSIQPLSLVHAGAGLVSHPRMASESERAPTLSGSNLADFFIPESSVSDESESTRALSASARFDTASDPAPVVIQPLSPSVSAPPESAGLLSAALGSKVRPIVEDFELGEVIGEGSFAFVRNAKPLSHYYTDGHRFGISVLRRNRVVAVKSVRKRYLASAEEVQSLLNELEIHKELSHPNIVKLYDVYEDPPDRPSHHPDSLSSPSVIHVSSTPVSLGTHPFTSGHTYNQSSVPMGHSSGDHSYHHTVPLFHHTSGHATPLGTHSHGGILSRSSSFAPTSTLLTQHGILGARSKPQLGHVHIILERVFGESLADTLQGWGTKTLPECLAKTVIGSTLKALQHLHSKGILHGDIKPQNILIELEGVDDDPCSPTPRASTPSVSNVRNRLDSDGYSVNSMIGRTPSNSLADVDMKDEINHPDLLSSNTFAARTWMQVNAAIASPPNSPGRTQRALSPSSVPPAPLPESMCTSLATTGSQELTISAPLPARTQQVFVNGVLRPRIRKVKLCDFGNSKRAHVSMRYASHPVSGVMVPTLVMPSPVPKSAHSSVESLKSTASILATCSTQSTSPSQHNQNDQLNLVDSLSTRELYAAAFPWTMAGTMGYMAPEVFSRRPYGLSADLWAVGIILYEILGGHAPFLPYGSCLAVDPEFSHSPWVIRGDEAGHGPSSSSNVHSHASRGTRESVSPEAIDLCKKLLARDPLERLTAEEALAHPWFKGAVFV